MSQPTQHPSRTMWFGVLAVVVAGGTAFGVWRVVDGYRRALDIALNPPDAADVLVATRELAVGERIADGDIELRRLSDAGHHPGYLHEAEIVVGETVVERVFAGEPLRRERLTLGGGSLRPEALLEPGTRAVTVKVERAAGVGGFLVAGAYVDVIVTLRPDANQLGANWVTETIVQAVRVLAVGDTLVGATEESKKSTFGKDRGASGRPREVYATLEVEPDEAEKVAMATSRGDLYLSLRAPEDYDLVLDEAPLITNALVGIAAKPSPARASRLEKRKAQKSAPPAVNFGPQTEVISGREVKVETIDASTGQVVHPEKRR